VQPETIDEMKQAVIASGYDLDELLVYKCEHCKTIVTTRPLSNAFTGGSQAFILLTLDHIRTCEDPRVHVYGSNQDYINLGGALVSKMQAKVGMYGKTYPQVLARSIYNSAILLLPDEYAEYMTADIKKVVDEVAEREHLPQLGAHK
jgi:hypothetical protein